MRAITISTEGFAAIRVCLDLTEKDIAKELRQLEGRMFFRNDEEIAACRRVLARIAAVRRELEG
jgi:hypothetical protein